MLFYSVLVEDAYSKMFLHILLDRDTTTAKGGEIHVCMTTLADFVTSVDSSRRAE